MDSVFIFRFMGAEVTLYMYPKTHIARDIHHIYFYLDSLSHQCRKVVSLIQVKSISFATHHVEYILLSSYVVWRNDLLNHTMLLDGFILLESFVTPAGISMASKLRKVFFPILWVIWLHWYSTIVECIAIIIPTYHSEICLKSAVLDHGSNRSIG